MANIKQKQRTPEEIRKEARKLRPPVPEKEFLSTGSLVFDHLLGGGLRTGDAVLLLGHAQSGKTTFILLMIYSLIQAGKRVLYFNTEGKNDYSYLKRAIGIDESLDPNTDDFLNIVETFDLNRQEDVYRIAMDYILHRMVDVVFIDSVSALSPSAYANTIENPAFAASTLLNNKVIPRIANLCMQNNILVVYTAQYRPNLDNPYDKNIQGGTYVMRHGVSVILDLKSATCDIFGNVTPDTKKSERLSYLSTITIEKGQSSLVEKRSASTVVLLPNMTPSYDTASEVLNVGGQVGLFIDKDGGVIDYKQRGATIKIHYYNDKSLGNRNDAIKLLREDSELMRELYEAARQKILSARNVTVMGVPKSFSVDNDQDALNDDIM